MVVDVASTDVIFIGADSLTQTAYSLNSRAVSSETSLRIVSLF
jgi:hypothetical protein